MKTLHWYCLSHYCEYNSENNDYKLIEDYPIANPCNLYNFTLSTQSANAGCDLSSSVVAGMYKWYLKIVVIGSFNIILFANK